MFPLLYFAFGFKICFASQIFVTTIDVVDDEKLLVDLDAFPIFEKFLKFEVKGCNDVHLVFCPTVNKHAPLYHITIGGWSNTKSILARERVNYEIMDQLDAVGLMDCNNYKPYWVSWENGYIRIGSGNDVDVNVILSYQEVCPFAIQNIELSASESQTIDWIIYKTDTPPFVPTPTMVQKAFEEVFTCPSFKMIKTTKGHSKAICANQCLYEIECSAFYFHANAEMCYIMSDSAESNVFDSSYYKLQAWTSR